MPLQFYRNGALALSPICELRLFDGSKRKRETVPIESLWREVQWRGDNTRLFQPV